MLNMRTASKQISQLSYQQQNQSESHYNIAKQKIKDVLRKSKSKLLLNSHKAPLKQQSTNVPLISIDLSQLYKRLPSIQPLQKCRNELSSQKKILLLELQAKQEKVERLRQTYRTIQTSKSKELLLKHPDYNRKISHFQTIPKLIQIHPDPEQTNKQLPVQQNHRMTIASSNRTQLFPLQPL